MVSGSPYVDTMVVVALLAMMVLVVAALLTVMVLVVVALLTMMVLVVVALLPLLMVALMIKKGSVIGPHSTACTAMDRTQLSTPFAPGPVLSPAAPA